jgi:outer membrane protein assembly factor BamB
MYSFFKSLENVYKYQAKNKQLVHYQRNNNSLYFNDKLIENNVHTFVFNGDIIIFSTENFTIKKVTENSAVETLLENCALGELLLSNFEIVVANTNTYEQFVYDFQKELKTFNLYSPPAYKTEAEIFFTKFQEPIINALSLETGECLWETNISIEGDTDPRIKQVLGISGDILVVFTFGSTLVGLDIHTGKILWSIFPKGFYPSGFTGMAWCWHLEYGYLYLLRHQYYLRINLSNQQLEVLWQTPVNTLEFEDCNYTKDHIYFMAIDKKSSIFNTSILGVFDRKALKIVWQYDKPIDSSQPPQSDGKKLYCIDNEGTLHIFEREEVI